MLAGAGLPYAFVGALAAAGALWCLLLGRDVRLAPDPALARAAAGFSPDALGEVWASRPLRLLAFAMLAYTATQMCLNTYLMSHAVREWRVPVAEAARWVALLQAGGLAGRLFWGWVGQRIGGANSLSGLLGALGLAMAALGAAMLLWPGTPGGSAFGAVVALTGFTASGWNGVMIAEVARIAGPARAGAVSGAVIMFGYGGLAVAPLAFVTVSAQGGMGGAFLALFAAAAVAGLALLAAAGFNMSARRPP
jgi:fucose permease